MSKAVISATWDDAPHLSEKRKRDMMAALSPHQRDARSKGIPDKGAGAIYPVAESDVVITPIVLPAYYPRAYALDVGWNRTAALWGAKDRETDTLYCYAEHYRAEAEPSVHAAAIRAKGAWVPGLIDPAARGRKQDDGQTLYDMYVDLGLNLTKADNSVEGGIQEVWERLSTGRLKFFTSCANLLDEFRLYRRDTKGRVVKENDHLMDCLRYLVLGFDDIASVQPSGVSRRRGSNLYRG